MQGAVAGSPAQQEAGPLVGGLQTAERPLESVVSLGHVTENIRPWEQLVKLISSSI